MFRTNKHRTLERQLSFKEKYAVELNAIGNLITISAIGIICFSIGFVMGGGI